MAIQDHYHIRLRNRRTTTTVDRVISKLLAVIGLADYSYWILPDFD